MRLLFVFRIALNASTAAIILRKLAGVWLLFGQSAWLPRLDWPGFAGRLDLAVIMLEVGIAVAASSTSGLTRR